MSRSGSRVIVVGAGVVGLTCAVRLLEAGHRVDIVARDLPRETTSAVAAGLWYPYRALPQDRVTTWARTSYAAFAALAAPPSLGGDPEAGVRMVPGTEVHLGEGRPTRGGASACPIWSGRSGATGLDRWLVLPHPGGRHGGLPRLAHRAGRGAGRVDHPAQPHGLPRDAAGLVVNVPGSGPGCSAATGPGTRCAARSSWSSSSAWTGGGWTRRVRRISCPTRAMSSSAAPTWRASGAGRLAGVAAAILARAARLVPAVRDARVLGTAWACGRCVRRCAWSGSATSCTATATAAPASPSAGARRGGRRAARLMGGLIRAGHPPAGSLARVSRSRIGRRPCWPPSPSSHSRGSACAESALPPTRAPATPTWPLRGVAGGQPRGAAAKRRPDPHRRPRQVADALHAERHQGNLGPGRRLHQLLRRAVQLLSPRGH